MTDWPSTTATFPGTCKECDATWKKGVKIYGINADTDKQKRWCSNGNCPDSAGTPPPKSTFKDNPEEIHKLPDKITSDYERSVEIVGKDIVDKSRASWIIALDDAQLVHSQTNSETIRAKYILACVFYKGLMGVS